MAVHWSKDGVHVHEPATDIDELDHHYLDLDKDLYLLLPVSHQAASEFAPLARQFVPTPRMKRVPPIPAGNRTMKGVRRSLLVVHPRQGEGLVLGTGRNCSSCHIPLGPRSKSKDDCSVELRYDPSRNIATFTNDAKQSIYVKGLHDRDRTEIQPGKLYRGQKAAWEVMLWGALVFQILFLGGDEPQEVTHPLLAGFSAVQRNQVMQKPNVRQDVGNPKVNSPNLKREFAASTDTKAVRVKVKPNASLRTPSNRVICPATNKAKVKPISSADVSSGNSESQCAGCSSWEVGDKIGKGAFATVHKAWINNDVYAWKRPCVGREKYLEDEMEILQMLRHVWSHMVSDIRYTDFRRSTLYESTLLVIPIMGS